MRALLLTLGHNSSAVMVENNQILWGYENERITLRKSDSHFPYEAMTFNPNSSIAPDVVYTTHWSPDGRLSSMAPKYWQPMQMGGLPIRTLSVDRSHHDAHMASALLYAGPGFPRSNTYGLVVDGFGILGEHFSIYDLRNRANPILIQRFHGYGTSLGLWYQYATLFMGLKMHEDEYKLLGYEAHSSVQATRTMRLMAVRYAQEWVDLMHTSIYKNEYDPMYNVSALTAVRDKIFAHLAEVCKKAGIDDPSSYIGRCDLSVYVQAVLEEVVCRLIHPLKADNLLLSGGVFYNVKLNRTLLNAIPGTLCVNPLAGDQGCALGLYAMDNPEFMMPRSLGWGQRVLRDVGKIEGLHVVNMGTGLSMVVEKLAKRGIVNLVRDGMEFGPRALCNTSTLAIPTMDNVQAINDANDRNTVMPMAPVMTRAQYSILFDTNERIRVWRSHAHMILALRYREGLPDFMMGAAHGYEWPEKYYTGRPQVVDPTDHFMYNVLSCTDGPLINTSFNYHGRPIALGMESVIQNHMLQRQRGSTIETVVIRNDN